MNTSKDNEENITQTDARSGGLLFWGIIALLGGILLVLTQFMELDAYMPWIALSLGLVMLAWGMITRSTGGLIAGGIVTGVGLGLTVVGPARMDESEAAVGFFLIFLALGFLSIPLTTKIFTDETHWWGFIPGGIILIVGLAMSLGGVWLRSLTLLQWSGPLALLILGGWLIYRYVAGSRNQ